MKKNSTELVFILDKSGSMRGLEKDTIGGFNSMLDKQKAIDGECRITTVLFDNNYLLLHDRIDMQAVNDMTEKDYFVGGNTALLDAVGRTLNKIINVQNSMAEEFRAENVVFVIITDGAENASREYSLDKIKSMIEQQKEIGWEFIFLGANMDAVHTASNFGIRPERAANYMADGFGTNLNFKMMSEAVTEFRATHAMPQAPFMKIDQYCMSAKKQKEENENKSKTSECSICGAKMSAGQIFCTRCGSKRQLINER